MSRSLALERPTEKDQPGRRAGSFVGSAVESGAYRVPQCCAAPFQNFLEGSAMAGAPATRAYLEGARLGLLSLRSDGGPPSEGVPSRFPMTFGASGSRAALGCEASVAAGWLGGALRSLLLGANVCCVVVCFGLAAMAAYRLHQLETLAREFYARADELERRYGGVPSSPGHPSGSSDAARQAAAWGAEVLGEMANGVPAGEAVQRSAARIHLPATRAHCAPSEAGSDTSRVSELRVLGNLGEQWLTHTERLFPSESTSPVPTATLVGFAGYRPDQAVPPTRYRAPMTRPSTSPPRGQF